VSFIVIFILGVISGIFIEESAENMYPEIILANPSLRLSLSLVITIIVILLAYKSIGYFLLSICGMYENQGFEWVQTLKPIAVELSKDLTIWEFLFAVLSGMIWPVKVYIFTRD